MTGLLTRRRLLTGLHTGHLSNFWWNNSGSRVCYSLYGGGRSGGRRLGHLCGLCGHIGGCTHSIVGKTLESAKSERHGYFCAM